MIPVFRENVKNTFSSLIFLPINSVQRLIVWDMYIVLECLKTFFNKNAIL